MRLKLLVALLLGTLAISGANAERAATVPEPRDARWLSLARARGEALDRHTGKIVILGDSLAARFPREVQRDVFGESFINLGISGDRTDNLLARLPLYDLARAQPRVVILIVGTNNLRLDDTPEEIVAGILAAVDTVRRQTPAPLIVSEILPRGRDLAFRADEIAAINARLTEAAGVHGFLVLHANAPIAAAAGNQGREAIFVDTVHLTPQGYGVLADEIRAVMPRGGDTSAGDTPTP